MVAPAHKPLPFRPNPSQAIGKGDVTLLQMIDVLCGGNNKRTLEYKELPAYGRLKGKDKLTKHNLERLGEFWGPCALHHQSSPPPLTSASTQPTSWC